MSSRVRAAVCFAIKANYAVVDGEERAVQKETTGKKSKRGRLTVELEDGEYKTFQSGQGRIGTAQDLLGEEIFRDGQSCRTECFFEIRGASPTLTFVSSRRPWRRPRARPSA